MKQRPRPRNHSNSNSPNRSPVAKTQAKGLLAGLTHANVMGVLAKYPRPVDSARNLHEYYMYAASEAGTLETTYSRMASPDAFMNGQLNSTDGQLGPGPS